MRRTPAARAVDYYRAGCPAQCYQVLNEIRDNAWEKTAIELVARHMLLYPPWKFQRWVDELSLLEKRNRVYDWLRQEWKKQSRYVRMGGY